MSTPSRRRVATRVVLPIAVVLVAVLAAAFWWLDRRTRPEAVGPRFVEALLERRPGTTVDAWSGGVLRVTLSSGVSIDVRLRTLFDACRGNRVGCSSAVSRALDDVDRADRATREPQRTMLRPAIVAGTPPGYTLGYVTESLVGPYEVRYALVDGLASTFVTSAIADRLGLTREALGHAAIAALHAEPAATLDALPDHPTVFAVRGADDAAALLLDRDRMKAFAARIGATRLYAAIPARAALYLAKADAAGATALAQAMPAGGFDLLAYDVDAPDGATITSVPHR